MKTPEKFLKGYTYNKVYKIPQARKTDYCSGILPTASELEIYLREKLSATSNEDERKDLIQAIKPLKIARYRALYSVTARIK